MDIKFRGKRIDNNKWVYGSYLKHQKTMPCPMGHQESEDDYEHLIIYDGFADWNLPRGIEAVQVDPSTVRQFTGLKDINGAEIFEGDIYEYDNSNYGYGDPKQPEKITSVLESIESLYGDAEILFLLNNCKIIGNKWDVKEDE